MIYLNDGRVGLSVEPRGGTIRALLAPTDDPHTPYCATCTYTRLTAEEISLSAFSGTDVGRSHLMLIAQWAYARGYRWIYADRAAGHVLPDGKRRTERPLKGWYEYDLQALQHMFTKAQNRVSEDSRRGNQE